MWEIKVWNTTLVTKNPTFLLYEWWQSEPINKSDCLTLRPKGSAMRSSISITSICNNYSLDFTIPMQLRVLTLSFVSWTVKALEFGSMVIMSSSFFAISFLFSGLFRTCIKIWQLKESHYKNNAPHKENLAKSNQMVIVKRCILKTTAPFYCFSELSADSYWQNFGCRRTVTILFTTTNPQCRFHGTLNKS